MKLVVSLTALFFSIVIHEVAHGYAAYRLGDPTARNANRLTLNPLAHIDPMGSIVLPILLVLMHSPVLIGWAKPVPFNPAYFRNVKKGIMLVGAAGPASNLALALVAGFLFRIITPGGVMGLFLLHCCVINVILATFNLIYTIVSPPAGSLSDRIGRRKVIVGGWLLYSMIRRNPR